MCSGKGTPGNRTTGKGKSGSSRIPRTLSLASLIVAGDYGREGSRSHLSTSSLCNLCVLCVSVVVVTRIPITTGTQRTQRLHREEKNSAPAFVLGNGSG